MKKWISLLLVISLMLAVLTAASAGSLTPVSSNSDAHTIECRDYAVYVGSIDSVTDEMPFYFMDGVDDMPWVETKQLCQLLIIVYSIYYGDQDYDLSYEYKGSVAEITRENEYTMSIDFAKNTITFSDYNGFLHSSDDTSLLDVLSASGYNASGEAELFQRDAQASYDRYGDEMTLDLGEYYISLVFQDGKGYIPLQTVGDFLLSTQAGLCTYYNGKAVFLANSDYFADSSTGELTALGEYYYSAAPTKRSKALAEFGYNELCLMLDNIYGLKSTHDIESFDQIFWQIGFDEDFQSTNPVTADEALLDFIDMYLDDLHTEFSLYSWMAGNREVPDPFGPSDKQFTRQVRRYDSLREAGMGSDFYKYQEVGDTAYITFDHFETGSAGDYYAVQSLDELPDDTIGLMIYAYAQIYRKNSPIKNVVFDLTNNLGGEVDAALYLLAFVLGDAEISIKDTFTGAQSTMVYRADVNLDRMFDSRDTLDDMHIYCLISPVSFSCGNLVPAAFKASQMVTLIGRTSGGGSCTVLHMSTAWGTSFEMSGTQLLSFRKNGSFYSIDQGVEPDIYVDHMEMLYDRQALTDFINGLT